MQDSDLLSNGSIKRVARIKDIARMAGVGTATVDRVLNDRENVREDTRQRVLQAKTAIELGGFANTKSRPWRLKVILPEDSGPPTEFLGKCFYEIGTQGEVTIDVGFSKRMEPAVLSRKLYACYGQGYDAVMFQALDDPRVRDAVSYLTSNGIPCLCVLSDLPGSSALGYVGINNRAAGSTSGFLMGNMLRMPGKIALLTAGQLYCLHEDREIGFRSIMRKRFPHLEIIGTMCSNDSSTDTYNHTLELLETLPDLVGLYCLGGGVDGVVNALKQREAVGEVLLIAHNLTSKTKIYLLDSSLNIVIHQNMRSIAEKAVQVAKIFLETRKFVTDLLPVEIITSENIQGAIYQ